MLAKIHGELCRSVKLIQIDIDCEVEKIERFIQRHNVISRIARYNSS